MIRHPFNNIMMQDFVRQQNTLQYLLNWNNKTHDKIFLFQPTYLRTFEILGRHILAQLVWLSLQWLCNIHRGPSIANIGVDIPKKIEYSCMVSMV